MQELVEVCGEGGKGIAGTRKEGRRLLPAAASG